ncbi:EF-hand domain-containing protein [Streptomyces sp. NPDC003038]|uniref:EF-hand domain-containing protein n=1 Tax=unclassified Streptomyces TaxID=2593676 RepID=UPI0033A22C75
MSSYDDKLLDRFATFDRDGDGYITEADFLGMAKRITSAFGLAESAAKSRALMEGARRYFRGLADIADSDKDGRISKQEFVTSAAEHLHGNPDGFEATIRPWAEAVIAIADTDSDGRVDIGEWERMLQAMGASAKAAGKAREIDTDGDGFVSVAEVLEVARRFYTSDSPMREFAAAR